MGLESNEEKIIYVEKESINLNISRKDDYYFRESRKWYNEKFLSQIPSRMLFLFFLTLSSISLYYAAKIIIGSFPLEVRYNLVIKTNREYGTRINIKKLKVEELGRQKKSPFYNVIAFFAKNYLEMRESYDFLLKDNHDSKNISLSSVLNNKTNFVELYSSKEVLTEYKNNIVRQYDSFINLYNSHAKRSVIIKKITFIETEDSFLRKIYKRFTPSDPPQNIVIYYDLINYSTNEVKKRKCYISYIADLRKKKIKGDTKNTDKNFSFYVTSYKIIQG